MSYTVVDVDDVPAEGLGGAVRFIRRVAGSGVLRVGGEELELRPGRYVRVEPGVVRQPVAGPDGLAWVAVGAVPGGVYAPRGPF